MTRAADTLLRAMLNCLREPLPGEAVIDLTEPKQRPGTLPIHRQGGDTPCGPRGACAGSRG